MYIYIYSICNIHLHTTDYIAINSREFSIYFLCDIYSILDFVRYLLSAKAATLVAEEIEFLGGKAILENIFARSDMVRRV